MREANGAIFNTQELMTVDESLIALLKDRAKQAGRRRFRLCLHHSPDEAVQEMIIAACREAYSRPHRHPGRSILYHVIEGQLRVCFFEETGKPTETIELGPPGGGKPFCFRLSSGGWYMPVVRSPMAVYIEVLSGPNPDLQATEYADWSPGQDDPAAIAAFLKKLGARE
jgi:cupin fold WbuC family metalloprotein